MVLSDAIRKQILELGDSCSPSAISKFLKVNIYTVYKVLYPERAENHRKKLKVYYKQHNVERQIYELKHRLISKDRKQRYMTKYCAKRYKTDPIFKLVLLMRVRIKDAIKKNLKHTSTKRLLGCTPQELKQYLESKFKPGMTWENHGKWHIDHVKPCAAFNLTDINQQKQCFHYTNLQPLWKIENLKKGSNV